MSSRALQSFSTQVRPCLEKSSKEVSTSMSWVQCANMIFLNVSTSRPSLILSRMEAARERGRQREKRKKEKEEAQRKFLHKGISERSFEHKFQLGDHVKVLTADIENGLLHIELERLIPETLKPRKIEIGASLIENS